MRPVFTHLDMAIFHLGMIELLFISRMCVYFGEERLTPSVEASHVLLSIIWITLQIVK